jgi:hypothetical protein
MDDKTTAPAMSAEEKTKAQSGLIDTEMELVVERNRRFHFAMAFELLGYALFALVTLASAVTTADIIKAPFAVWTQPQVAGAFAFLFVMMLATLLTGRTPLVWLYGVISKTDIKGIALDFDLKGIPEPTDEIERHFRTYIERSQAAKDSAQRRPTALLFIGGGTAILGVFFFIATLPGGAFGVLPTPTSTSMSTPAPSMTAQDLWPAALQLLPRLLMLIFIQVLAGFFLKQYRAAMEDFRYYESVLRHRESQYLSYILRKEPNGNQAMLKFADELLKEREFGVLVKGQTTTTIEAQRAEGNDINAFYERIAALVTPKKDEKRTKGARAEKKKDGTAAKTAT